MVNLRVPNTSLLSKKDFYPAILDMWSFDCKCTNLGNMMVSKKSII
jgi:hypothetical protein